MIIRHSTPRRFPIPTSPIAGIRLLRRFALLAMLPVLLFPVAHGLTVGGWQPNPDGALMSIAEAHIDGQRSLIVGGAFQNIAGQPRERLARFKLGAGDPVLDANFIPSVNGDVRCIVIDAEGRILIGGLFTEVTHGPVDNRTTTSRNRMARLNPDGSLDMTFDPNFGGGVRGIVVTPDGGIYAAGAFTTPRVRVARLDPETSAFDPSFDPRPGSEVYAIALQPQADQTLKLVIAGEFTKLNPGGGPDVLLNRVARLGLDGEVDAAFNPNAGNWVSNVVAQADGKILLGGAFTTLQPPGQGAPITRNRIARLTPDGQVDAAFDPGTTIANSNVATIALAANGHFFVGGNFTSGTGTNRLVEFDDESGAVWWGDADLTVQSLLLENRPGGSQTGLFAGGLFSQIGGESRQRLAHFASLAAEDSLRMDETLPGSLLWERGGHAPAFAFATLDFLQHGIWSPPVFGIREGSNWRFNDIPHASVVRVTGRIAGGFHSASSGIDQRLMISPAGKPLAWGSNANGKLGDGTLLSRTTPVEVVIDDLGDVVAVAVGNDHSLALKADGTVWAWGRNAEGQLGDGTIFQRTTPVQVAGIGGVVAISAGISHSLALKTDGTVWAWGTNSSGQLGDGTISQRNAPVQVGGLGGVTAVAAGYYHSLAVKSDGTVWAWGNNGSGQIGDGSVINRNTPVQVSGLTGAVAVAGGGFHSLAVKSDGAVSAWGQNAFGQLGNGTTSNSNTPVPVASIDNAVTVAAGESFSLALTSAGAIRSWGRNSAGQLGEGTTIQRTTPVQVVGIDTATAAVAGSFHSLAVLSDGTVRAWGNNGPGQLGDGTSGNNRSTPVQVSDLDGAIAVAAGGGHSLAIAVEPPSAILLSNDSVVENEPAGTLVGEFSSMPSNMTYTYTLVTGKGDVDNASFVLAGAGGSQLLTAEVFDYETKSAYSIRVRSTNAAGASGEEIFEIYVIDVNEPPTITGIGDQTIAWNTSTGALPFSVSDPETPAENLVVTATSGNTKLVPVPNIVIEGSGSDRTVTLTPADNELGLATITLTVSDGVSTANTQFLVLVNSAPRTIGPDAFGYTATNDVEYQVTDISSTGTILVLVNNLVANVVEAPIGFSFSFSGQIETEVLISTHGAIWPSEANISQLSDNLSNIDLRSPLIAPFWHIPNDSTPVSIIHQTSGLVGERTFTVQWDYIFTALSFQVVLHEATGEIRFNYAFVPSDFTGAVIGISDSSGSLNGRYLQWSFSTRSVSSGSSLLFTPPPPDGLTAWLQTHGIPPQDIGNSGPDGIANLLKYAFNLDPTEPDVRRLSPEMLDEGPLAGLPMPEMVDGRLRLYFLQPEGNSGIVLTPLFHDDLTSDAQQWTQQTTTHPVPGRTANGYELRYAEDPAEGPRRFGKIEVTVDGTP